MSRAEITMKSGAVVVFDATEVRSTRAVTGGLTKLDWTTPNESNRRLLTIELSEIAAIVFVEEEEEGVTHADT